MSILSIEEIQAVRNEMMKGYPDARAPGVTQLLDPDQLFLFMKLVTIDVTNKDRSVETITRPEFTSIIGPEALLTKRLEALGKPITFSVGAFFAPSCFCRQPGAAVVYLCDLLLYARLHNKTFLTTRDITEVYPNWFYTEESLGIIIDDFMKTGIHPYSHVYGINDFHAKKIFGSGVESPDWMWPH